MVARAQPGALMPSYLIPPTCRGTWSDQFKEAILPDLEDGSDNIWCV